MFKMINSPIKKTILVFILLLSFTACSSNEEICACLEAGKNLNDYASKLLTKEVNEQELKKMENLKSEKNKKCDAFKTMDGKKMMELKEDCEGN
jgi:hypothetical protein